MFPEPDLDAGHCSRDTLCSSKGPWTLGKVPLVEMWLTLQLQKSVLSISIYHYISYITKLFTLDLTFFVYHQYFLSPL